MDQREKPPTTPASLRNDEGFDFELTDIEDARRTLDTESMSQFEVASVERPEYWKKVRRPSLPTDRALTGSAIDWLLSLPSTLRPEKLSLEFPRIVNGLSEVWHEPDLCQAAFDSLLSEGRKGRKGFPPAVHDELIALRNWTQLF